MNELPPNTPETIRAIRSKMGLTQTELAKTMGYQQRAWSFKEDLNPTKTRRLMDGEFEYLLLLAGEHPRFELKERLKK